MGVNNWKRLGRLSIMIDLIANGLALQKQKASMDDSNPQIIRNESANDKGDGYKKSAQSANKMDRLEASITVTSTIDAADYAEQAETQFSGEYTNADCLRKTCGFDDFGLLQEDISQVLKVVQCNYCIYFTPDSIGNGAGIGTCAFNVKWTQETHGRMPLYRYAERHCVQYKQLEDAKIGVQK